MVFKGLEGKLIFRVILLLLTLSLPAFVFVKGWPELLVFLAPLLAYQVAELIKFLKRAQQDFNLFVEAVHYRDFSKFFNEKDTPDLQLLRKGFNEINTAFKSIAREKETQHQHLQQILEMVTTGIMTYNIETGNVLLMNDALKKLLQVPFMKNINGLAKREPALLTVVETLLPGQTPVITTRQSNAEKNSIKLMLSATVFQSEGQTYKLVAFQNVNEALDQTESKAWEKLLHVLTHEIMNSVAPISSLAGTLKTRLQEMNASEITEADLEDMDLGIGTIQRRSAGLLKFAETYRNLSKITELHTRPIKLAALFGNLQRLMQPTLEQKDIILHIDLKDPELTLNADPDLLDQVLINLLVNAIDAVKNQPEAVIVLSGEKTGEGKVLLKVGDNGTGMPPEVQENIFIPFFSTKKQGSGIGLSLCKQIVMLHHGSIRVQSAEGEGTVFKLVF